MENLLSSSEAREMLGNMASSSFKEYVDSGRIRKIIPPGKKQGKYVREDVELLAKEVLPFIRKEKRIKQQNFSQQLDYATHQRLSTIEKDLEDLKQQITQHFNTIEVLLAQILTRLSDG
ncbi:hypothetical protein EPA93_19220 [Ktedonosporobacter rubrisoli]|uniref:HTH merR-type domain-containing protein n=1 Tax=Ktedonosporobacter rubrisoli TaxID=2509675 RepID=A0A4V0YZ02_KTERU|nr:hypothetical protein [Ktedonosporobacter rubrisoli]QBD78011.1 hypothetical protein EPA93_19220 [Ktedonosporobacter rubrisoli]